MSEPADRRRAPRLRICACVALEALGRRNDCDQGLGTVRDVSRTGIGLETGQPPLPGQTVVLRIALGDVIEEVTARTTRVTRTRNPSFYHVGLEWNPENAGQSSFLEQVFAEAETLKL